jgi:hypothetical protein
MWFENRGWGRGIRPDHAGSNDDLDPVCRHFLLGHSRVWLPREESRILLSVKGGTFSDRQLSPAGLMVKLSVRM